MRCLQSSTWWMAAFLVIAFCGLANAASSPAEEQRLPDRILLGHTDGVFAVAFFPDNQRAASASADGTLRIWDTANGKSLRTISGHQGIVWTVSISPDGKSIASGSSDHTVRVWNPATGEQIAQLEGHAGEVRGVAFLPDGSLLSGANDGLRIWNVKTEKLLWKSTNAASVAALVVSRDGKRCAYTGRDGSTYVWDLPARKPLRHFGKSVDLGTYTYSLALSPDGKTVYAQEESFGNKLAEWDVATGRKVAMKVPDSVSLIMAAPDGKHLITELGDLCVYDAVTGHVLVTFDVNAFGGGMVELMHCLAISPDGKRLLCGGGGQFNAEEWQRGKNNVISVFSVPDLTRPLTPWASRVLHPLPADGFIEYQGTSAKFLCGGSSVLFAKGQVTVAESDLYWQLKKTPQTQELFTLIDGLARASQPAERSRVGLTAAQWQKSMDTVRRLDRVSPDTRLLQKLFDAFTAAPEGAEKAKATQAIMDRLKALDEEREQISAQSIPQLKATLTPQQIEALKKIP